MSRHSPYLLTSIDCQGTSSGGLSPIDSNSFFSQSRWSDEERARGRSLYYDIFDARDLTDNSAHSFYLRAVGHGDDFLKRIMGCALMFRIPSNGIDEALTSLGEISEFWLEKANDRSLPSAMQQNAGRVVSVHPLPELVIAGGRDE